MLFACLNLLIIWGTFYGIHLPRDHIPRSVLILSLAYQSSRNYWSLQIAPTC